VHSPSRDDVVQLHNGFPPFTSPTKDARGSLLARRSELARSLERLSDTSGSIDQAAKSIATSLRRGGKTLVAGNGGSAAEAQHFATELVGRFRRDRPPWAVVSLTADTALITALANDFGFETVFERQVCAHGKTGDVFIAFSTSGESENLVRAAQLAKRNRIYVIAVTGMFPSRLAAIANVSIQVPSSDSQVIQELHTVVLHILCELVESALCEFPTQVVQE
jgi:D-sedoheptulose 7-phosphate isomerase